MSEQVRITLEYFLNEAREFRKIMSDNKNSTETIENAFGCLFHVYILGTTTGSEGRLMDPKDHEAATNFWEMIATDWEYRRPYMMLRPTDGVAKV